MTLDELNTQAKLRTLQNVLQLLDESLRGGQGLVT